MRISAEKEYEQNNARTLDAEKKKLKTSFELALKTMRDENVA